MTTFPLNNTKFSWNDLKEIGVIADKSYYYTLYGFDNIIEFYENIEKNVDIKCLKDNTLSKKFFTNTNNLSNKHDIECKYNDKNKIKVIYVKSINTGAEFFAFTYYSTLIILFIGSNSFIDLKHDLALNKERVFLNGKFCTVHRGFYEQYYSVRKQIIEIFNQYYKNYINPKVLFIGHSLGIIGQLCAFDIKNICENSILDMVSFGAPCIGDNTYAKLVDNIFDNNIRFVNNEDIIPVSLELFGYVHSGNIIKFDDDDSVLYEYSKTWNDIKNIGFAIIKDFIPYFGTNIILYHLMSDYINRIDKIILNTISNTDTNTHTNTDTNTDTNKINNTDTKLDTNVPIITEINTK